MRDKKHFLLARRTVQVLILLAFAAGPWLGISIARGTLASSLWLNAIPLSDPFVVLQSLIARHPLTGSAIVGSVLIAGFYALVGGRIFCGWVCPINIVTDSAQGLRRRLGLPKSKVLRIDKRLRYGILLICLMGSLISGVILWEFTNPINLLMRTVVFGLWVGGLIAIAGIFLFDFFVLSNGWCGHICPVGAFYGQIGRKSLVSVSASQRQNCNNCGDCFTVCPEPQVISPALRAINDHGPGIQDVDCLRCGRCIDVCEQQVFEFSVGKPPRISKAAYLKITDSLP